MSYLKASLSVISAVFSAEMTLAFWWIFRNWNSEKATGLGVVPFAFLESLILPGFWVLTILFLLLFWRASKIGDSKLRMLIFWIPAVFASTITFLLASGFAYLWLRFGRL